MPARLALLLLAAAALAGCGSGPAADSAAFDAQAARAGLKAQESDMQDQMMMGP